MSNAAVQYDFEGDGTIKSYSQGKGIIELEDSATEVVYYGKLLKRAGVKQLEPGTRVHCKAVNREKGRPKAKEISVLS